MKVGSTYMSVRGVLFVVLSMPTRNWVAPERSYLEWPCLVLDAGNGPLRVGQVFRLLEMTAYHEQAVLFASPGEQGKVVP